jgi:hypothetical protein
VGKEESGESREWGKKRMGGAGRVPEEEEEEEEERSQLSYIREGRFAHVGIRMTCCKRQSVSKRLKKSRDAVLPPCFSPTYTTCLPLLQHSKKGGSGRVSKSPS